ncbi:hypothetical protein ACSFA2_16785 [Variovorax sp. LT2P21]|uniref:hypothetical protein n=1 Tax=Variovorax sp. LT2P21 TaxID=3443731 RepID=UPI003F44DD61
MNLKHFAAHIATLSDEDLIDARHASLVEHRTAEDGERDIALQKTFITERAMIARFGLGEAYKRLAAKHPQPRI